MALENLIFGCLWCITIVGIPFGLQFFKQHTLQNGVVQFAVNESETTETDWMQYAAILLKQKGKKENEDQ